MQRPGDFYTAASIGSSSFQCILRRGITTSHPSAGGARGWPVLWRVRGASVRAEHSSCLAIRVRPWNQKQPKTRQRPTPTKPAANHVLCQSSVVRNNGGLETAPHTPDPPDTSMGQPPQQATPRRQLRYALPTGVERVLSALMFLLPLSEGLYRLAVVALEFLRHSALELLLWTHVQHQNLLQAAATPRTADELQACQMVLAWAQMLIAEASSWLQHLMLLAPQTQLASADVQAMPAGELLSRWGATALCSPFSVWDMVCVVVMLLVYQVATNVLESREGASSPEQPLGSQLQELFKRPEVVMICCLCGLLLRASWAPMASLSGFGAELYRPAAVFLTSAMTLVAGAAVLRMLFGSLERVDEPLQELVSGVQGVVTWHRALLTADTLLAMFASIDFNAKLNLAMAYACYLGALEHINGKLEQLTSKPRK